MSTIFHSWILGFPCEKQEKTNMEIIYPDGYLSGTKDITDTLYRYNSTKRSLRHLTSSCTFSAFCLKGSTKLSFICHKLLSMQILSYQTNNNPQRDSFQSRKIVNQSQKLKQLSKTKATTDWRGPNFRKSNKDLVHREVMSQNAYSSASNIPWLAWPVTGWTNNGHRQKLSFIIWYRYRIKNTKDVRLFSS